MLRFPTEVMEFAEHFVFMQELRHSADYDPDASFDRSQVAQLVEETLRLNQLFKGTPRADQRAFSIYVLLRSRSD